MYASCRAARKHRESGVSNRRKRCLPPWLALRLSLGRASWREPIYQELNKELYKRSVKMHTPRHRARRLYHARNPRGVPSCAPPTGYSSRHT